jgi:hypothetical protein
MDRGDADDGDDARAERRSGSRTRRVAPGQVWIACASCRHPVELSDTVETVEGHVCPACAVGP